MDRILYKIFEKVYKQSQTTTTTNFEPQTKMHDLFCFGKANTDYVAQVTDEFLKEFNLEKGIGRAIDEKELKELEKRLKDIKKLSGGSSANVAAGFANIGKSKSFKVAYAATIGNDENGKKFQDEMQKFGIDCYFRKIKGSSPVCITLVTPDTQRTFAWCTGVAKQYSTEFLPKEVIVTSKFFHTDAYELDSAEDAAKTAIELARKNGKRISFDVANEHVINKKKKEIENVIHYSNILFANETEFKTLFGEHDLEELINKHKKRFSALVLKLGKKGAIIGTEYENHQIPIFPVKAIDTNGAGDAFAAGFLYGSCMNYSTEFSGLIGSYHASLVVSQIGPRLTHPVENIEELVANYINKK